MTLEHKKSKVGLLGLVPLIYVMVAAGGFGAEDMISEVGPGITMAIFMILPFIWSMPFGLVAAELSSAYPVDGGMYVWARQVLGEKAGFASGWCYLVAGFVEPALFAVLSINYLKALLPFELNPFTKWLVCALVVIILSIVNLVGIKALSNISTGVTFFMLIPFAILIVLSFTHLEFSPIEPFTKPGMSLWEAAAQGLLLGIWLNTGYEAVSTMSGEIENGSRIVPKAIMIAIPFISIMYLITIFPTLAAVGHWTEWGTDSRISFAGAGLLLGEQAWGVIGGQILNKAFVIGAGLSSLSICAAYIGAYSRIASSMSEQGQFFKAFSKTHKRFGTPYVAIIAIAVVSLIACTGAFVQLVNMAAILYAVPILLMFVAAIKLRLSRPNLKLAYKVPLKKTAFIIFALVPMIIYAYSALVEGGIFDLVDALAGGKGLASPFLKVLIHLGLVATFIPAYALFKFVYKKGQYWKEKSAEIEDYEIQEVNEEML